MKYFSMFSGIGGFELGIERALDNRKLSTPRAEVVYEHSTDSSVKLGNGGRTRAICVGYSEIDKYADQIYQKHFGGRNYGDATKINARELPDFELLVGGFPCQAFSVAGKRAGFNDTRGTLFFDIARILKEKRPRHLVLENVKGLLSHDQGKTFQTILGVLADLGYFVEWQVLNSKDFGVPQNRERVFIVGHLGGEPRRKVFPITGYDRQNTKTRLEKSSYSETVSTRTGSTARGQQFVAMRWNRTEKGKAYRREAQKRGRDLTPFNDGHRTLEPAKDGVIGTITSQAIAKDSLLGSGARIRRLTPLECERLQGFPDNWTEGLSDTQRYKTLGNAVTVNVVEAVITNLNTNYRGK